MAITHEIPKEAAKFKGATRDKVRRGLAALLERALRDDKKAVTVAAIRGEVGGDQNAITTCLRLWRAGEWSVADSWDDPQQPAVRQGEPAGDERAALMGRIRSAQTDGDREAVVHELAALVAGRVVDPDEAAQIRGALAEARQAAEAKRATEPPPEDPTRLLMATEEAMQVAQAVDWIVDEARRARVVAFVQRELESDMLEHPGPSPDAAGVGR